MFQQGRGFKVQRPDYKHFNEKKKRTFDVSMLAIHV